MKRFILFCGAEYYPFGGWQDAFDDGGNLQEYDTLAEVKEAGREFALVRECYFWWHVVDLEEGKIVWEGNDEYEGVPRRG